MVITPSVLQRFWSKVVIIDDALSCWLWTAFLKPDGYGHLRIGAAMEHAHRVSWVIAYGAIPDGLCVLHRCDVGHCVRPSHLFLGTRTINNVDRDAKGRNNIPAGSHNPNALLKETDILTIRQSTATRDELAALFNVSPSTIKSIKGHRSWTHV